MRALVWRYNYLVANCSTLKASDENFGGLLIRRLSHE